MINYTTFVCFEHFLQNNFVDTVSLNCQMYDDYIVTHTTSGTYLRCHATDVR